MTSQDARYIEFIQDVLISIHENIRELSERRNFADANELGHIDGKLQAYHEVLSILQMSGESFGIHKHETGL